MTDLVIIKYKCPTLTPSTHNYICKGTQIRTKLTPTDPVCVCVYHWVIIRTSGTTEMIWEPSEHDDRAGISSSIYIFTNPLICPSWPTVLMTHIFGLYFPASRDWSHWLNSFFPEAPICKCLFVFLFVISVSETSSYFTSVSHISYSKVFCPIAVWVN